LPPLRGTKHNRLPSQLLILLLILEHTENTHKRREKETDRRSVIKGFFFFPYFIHPPNVVFSSFLMLTQFFTKLRRSRITSRGIFRCLHFFPDPLSEKLCLRGLCVCCAGKKRHMDRKRHTCTYHPSPSLEPNMARNYKNKSTYTPVYKHILRLIITWSCG